MLNFVIGLTKTVVKTTVGLPITAAVDIVTLGGGLTDKRGQSYSGDMMDSITRSLKQMTDD